MEIIIDIAKDLILPIDLDIQESLDPVDGKCSYCEKFIK